MKRTFVKYGQDLFDQAFSLYQCLDNSVIILRDNNLLPYCREKLFELYGLNNIKVTTLESFKSESFNGLKLSGSARDMALYLSMSKESKKFFKIKSLFDAKLFSKNFFSLYEEFAEERKINIEELYKWQKEFFRELEIVKSNYKVYLIKNELNDRIFTYDIKNFYPSEYKNILLFDITYLSKLERAIFDSLGKKVQLFLHEGKYDQKEGKLLSIKLPELPKCQINEVPDDFAQSLFIKKDLNNSSKLNLCDVSGRGSFYLDMYEGEFSKTIFYKFLQDLLEILEGVELIDKSLTIRVDSLLKVKESILFSKYFEITLHDKTALLQLIKSGYKYLPKGFAIFTKLFENVYRLYKISKFDDFYQYFKNLNFDIVNRHEEYFSVLEELKAVNNSIAKEGWKSMFSKKQKLSVGILKYMIDILGKRGLARKKDNMKDIGSISGSHLVMFNFNKTQSYESSFFLTSSQRAALGFKSKEDRDIEDRYKKIKTLSSAEYAKIYYIKDTDLEIDPLVNEISYARKVPINKLCLDSRSIKKYFKSTEKSVSFKRNSYDKLPLSRDDFIYDNEFSIGFYDYNELTKCEYRYFLKAITKLSLQHKRVIYRVDPNLLGNLVHTVLNEVILMKQEDLKNGDFYLDYQEVKTILHQVIDENKLKIPTNYKRYYDKIFYPALIEGVISFYKSMKNYFRKNRVKNIYIEDSAKREICETDGISVKIKGKVDLRLDTENGPYLIDYKTGRSDSKQLDFYQILYYKGEKNVVKWFYKFFDMMIKQESKSNLSERQIVKAIEMLINNRSYRRIPNKSNCRFCEYVDICGVRGK